ncbi:MAG: XrtA system polysaccharide deacetylase [Candidatus Sulfotelmatobacter sp.]
MGTSVPISNLVQAFRAASRSLTARTVKKPAASTRIIPATLPRVDGVSIFSVDVEDWFHILGVPSVPAFSMWDKLPSRVERNFCRLLDLFSERKVHVTCFFLGWIGERYPHLVREAASRGHEIASHGYEHRLVFDMTPQEFFDDALRARIALEDISGKPVLGYRAAGFSAVEHTPWFFERLEAAGYVYDSSVFPAKRGHGGMVGFPRLPHVVEGTALVEFPMTVSDFLGQPICFFGGGYLRLFPEWLILRETRQVLANGQPVLFYIHPREIDKDHPHLRMNLARRFKSYVNLRRTEEKVKRILDSFPVISFEEFLKRNPWTLEDHARAVAG